MDDSITVKIAAFIKTIAFEKECIDLISTGYHSSDEIIKLNNTQHVFKTCIVHQSIVLLANKKLLDELLKLDYKQEQYDRFFLPKKRKARRACVN